jgi:mannose-6-phosphate isomerase-like protein (cupin superfamily)
MSEKRMLRLPTGELISIIHTGLETEGEVFEFEAVLPSGLSGPPAHWHRVEQETFEVIEGTLRVRVGHVVRHLGPGESVVVPPGIVHVFSNPADEPARVITRETPAGQLEAQLRVMASAGRLPPLLQLAEVNARNGFSFFWLACPSFRSACYGKVSPGWRVSGYSGDHLRRKTRHVSQKGILDRAARLSPRSAIPPRTTSQFASSRMVRRRRKPRITT